MEPIQVFDDVLEDPHGYRAECLAQAFGDVTIGPDTFRGIAFPPNPTLVLRLPALLHDPLGRAPEAVLTFLRQSCAGQPEPNYIHSDADMGEWTGVYYLNPFPHAGDGTQFWERTGTGQISGYWGAEAAALCRQEHLWHVWRCVPAKFNRLLVFRSDLFHSRALKDNYGEGDGARLVQMVFGRWPTEIPL